MEIDFLVVGSGAAGLVAALSAARAGARVLVVEKGSLWGGTSATSGGGIWIPGSHLAQAAGHPDDPEDAFRYLRTLSAPNVPDAQIRAYVDNARYMLEWIERAADLHFVPLPYPDYYPEVDGSSSGYRTHLLPGYSDGRALDPRAFATMQRASPAASLWGKINTTMEDTSAILVRAPGWFGRAARMVGRYGFDIPQRLKGPRDRWLTMGTALLGKLRLALDRESVPIWLESPLLSLVAAGGRVTGAIVRNQGEERRITVRRGVLLASGGFERNGALRVRHLPAAHEATASGSQHCNEGEGLGAAQLLGAATQNMDAAWWAPVFRIPGEARSRLSTVERALPHSIVVDRQGARYANEALCYHRFGEIMMQRSPSGVSRDPSWLIFDSRYRSKYPAGPVLPMIPDWLLPAAVRSVLVKAGTVEELAGKTGMPVSALAQTLSRFNRLATEGRDADFRRGDSSYDRLYGDYMVTPNPTLGPIDRPPYYAMPLYLGDIGTSGGLVTNEHGQVLDEGGAPIGGLYAAGNIARSVMGYSYPGAGATLGPGMTFAWLAARHATGESSALTAQ